MSGKRGEVDAEFVQVNRLVRHRLAGVQHGQRTRLVGAGDQLAHRCQHPGHIGMMGERNDFDTVVQIQRVQVDAPVVSHPVPAQCGPGAPGQLLPRDQVGVMLQLGGDDHVAGADGTLETAVPQHI
ncbi:Uncharacterised protein [Mycobacterium tuberculosis]|nr:Uncharacterised protein [Mycobacterium tuberculosis]